jgi:hypothetical protein
MNYEQALEQLGLNPDIRLRQMFELGRLSAPHKPIAFLNVFRSLSGERNTRFIELSSLPDGEHYFYTTPPVAQPAPVQEPVAWVLLREDEDGFEPIQFYGGKEKPETAAGELKPRFTLRPVCFADTTPSAQPAPESEEDLYDLAVKADNGGQP